MKRITVALAALLTFAFTACTPEQIATLGVTDPVAVQVLADLPDVAAPLSDGSVLEIDGSITAATAAAERLPAATELIPPVSVNAHPNDNVQRWYDTAMRAGWTPGTWHWLSCVINRETGGNPNAWNRKDPGSGSRGLVQINSTNLRWLRERGLLWDINELFNPYTNLRAANQMFNELGKGPWRSTSRGC